MLNLTVILFPIISKYKQIISYQNKCAFNGNRGVVFSLKATKNFSATRKLHLVN